MNEALSDFVARFDGILKVIDPDAVAEGLRALSELSDTGVIFPPTGWPLGLEPAASRALIRLLSGDDEPLDGALDSHILEPGPWIDLFHTSELLAEVSMDATQSVRLWNARELRSRARKGVLYLAISAAAHNHGHSMGWHIHPYNGHQQMGYRCFFDAKRAQSELSWERHGGAGQYRPWKDPAARVLPAGTSKDLHRACLEAVRSNSVLAPRRDPFRSWAARFGIPSRKAYVAHPPVTNGVPKPW